MPSFVIRVPRPDRGGRWIEYLRERTEAADAVAARLGLDEPETRPPRRRCGSSAAHGTEEELLAALLYEASTAGEEAGARRGRRACRRCERAALVRELVAERENRRHRPGRGFETLTLPLRDRLRLRRLPRSPTPPAAHVPVAAAVAEPRRRRPARGRAGRPRPASTSAHSRRLAHEYERLRGEGLVEEAPYALCLAYRIRYVLELDAREALHLIELRSGREGHPSYRAVAHEMRRRDRRGAPERRSGDDVRRRLDGGPARAAALRDAQ